MPRRGPFLFSVVTLVLSFLGLCELSLRFSSSFNEFAYIHTTPRNSDDFRIRHRLRLAQADRSKPSVAFIGTSTTRDGVDVRLFQSKYPGYNFFNLGGVYKMPEHEARFVDDYANAGIDHLVYWISGSDIFKFRGLGSDFHSDYYPGLGRYSEILKKPSLEALSQAYPSFWGDLFGNLFLTFRFREVLAEALENAALKFIGVQLPGDFDFFWQQQRFDDAELIAHRLRYQERSEGFFERRLVSSLGLFKLIARSTQRQGLRLLFLYSQGVCDEFRKDFAPYVLAAEQALADGLMQIANQHDNVRFEKMEPFACHQYAELFHLNSAGRHEFFQRVSKILDPSLRQTQ